MTALHIDDSEIIFPIQDHRPGRPPIATDAPPRWFAPLLVLGLAGSLLAAGLAVWGVVELIGWWVR